jgi:hypothetical protein
MQVTDGHRMDRGKLNAGSGQRLRQWLAGTRQDGRELRVAVEPPPQGQVTDERGVEAGVEQQPPAIAFEQHRGHRFPQPLGRRPFHRHRLGQVLPAQRQRHYPAHATAHAIPP